MRRLRGWLGGQSLLPLGVLAGLNLVDEFDRIAFATLTPEIRDSFGTNDATINSIATLAAVMVLISALPTGRLADRRSRVAISLGAALLWATCSFLTGLVPSLILLALVRIGAGIGRNANEIVHPSLITDLYEPESHPRAFMVHRLANPLAQASGLVAGALGATLGWQWTFVLLALPTLALAALLPRITEPARRGTDDERLELPVPETARRLRAVPALRRFWATAFFLGAAAVGVFQLVSVYFEQEFGMGPQGRGLVQFLVGLGWVSGILVGARAADQAPVAQAARLARICAGGFAVVALGAVGLSAAPLVGLALVATTVMASGNGVWQSPYFTAVGRIAPDGLSGQAYASSVLFYALGALLSIPVFILGDQVGYREAFVVIALLALIAAALANSVAPLIIEGSEPGQS